MHHCHQSLIPLASIQRHRTNSAWTFKEISIKHCGQEWKSTQLLRILIHVIMQREMARFSICVCMLWGDQGSLIIKEWPTPKPHVLVIPSASFYLNIFSHPVQSPEGHPICMAQSSCLGCNLTLRCSSFHACCMWISVRLVECKSLIPWVSGLWNILFSISPRAAVFHLVIVKYLSGSH